MNEISSSIPLRARSCGMAMVYVLGLAIVVGSIGLSFLSAAGNETQVSGTKQARFKLLHAAEAGIELARGRLQLATARPDWSALINQPVYAGSVNDIDVTALLEDIPGSPYDPYTNSRARLRAVSASAGMTVSVWRDIRTPDASEFSQYVGTGGDGATIPTSPWTSGTFSGKVFYDFASISVRDTGGVPTTYSGEVYASGNIFNDTGRPDSQVYLAGPPAQGMADSQQPRFPGNATANIRTLAAAQGNIIAWNGVNAVRVRLRVDGTVLVSTNGGTSWTSRACPINTCLWIEGSVPNAAADFEIEGDPGQGGANFRRFAGRMTVGGSRDGLIRGDIYYQDESRDLLGIVAKRHLKIQTDDTPADAAVTNPVTHITAVMMAEDGVFSTTKNTATLIPNLRYFGGYIYQAQITTQIYNNGGTLYGPVTTTQIPASYATSNREFDPKTRNAPPPAFPQLMNVNPSVLPGSFNVSYSSN